MHEDGRKQTYSLEFGYGPCVDCDSFRLRLSCLFVFGLMFANANAQAFEDFAKIGTYPAILTLSLPWSIIACSLKKYVQAGWVSLSAVASVPMYALLRYIIVNFALAAF